MNSFSNFSNNKLWYTIRCFCSTGSDNLSGAALISIIVETTPLVCITDKSEQEISDEKDLRISASKSYDPDSNDFSYS